MEMGEWLRGLGLAQYEATFREHDIDAEVLPELTEGDLEGLGISLGHRKRLLKAIRALQSGPPASEPAVAGATEPSHLAERRQLTVMFCDLVGSTALSARLDPEDLREVIGAYHRTVAAAVGRFDGFIARYMGDGVLVYFGYPRAHEDDAERAVRAGLDAVAAVKGLAAPAGKLQVRIGIATGPVVVGDLIGEGISEEHAVIGETPNLAARLQTLAQPGTIVLPASTRSLLGNLFKLRDLGRHELKGLSEPVEAWAVEGVSVFESRFELMRSAQLSAFIGREAELGLLMDRWDLARSGEGQLVLLSGEPGIGKSRILNELRARLDKEQFAALRFQCSPYYVNSAFYPIIDNFERALKSRSPRPWSASQPKPASGRGSVEETAEAKLDKLEALIVGEYGLPREDVRFIAAILPVPYETRYGAAVMTSQKFKDETLRALVDTVEAASQKRPSVMLFEDLHWADPSSLEALDLLVDRAGRIPLLMVLTHRPEFQSRWSHYSHVTALTLTKLTRAQSNALVSRLTGGKLLPGDLLEQILSKTDGVPLFVEELTKSILESAGLEDAGGRYIHVGAAHTLAIPLTLRDSLMSRLDRFMPVKEVAQIGAAIGHSFSYELIAAVAPHAKPELDQALGQLIASGLAFRHGTPPDATYSFKHALVRDAAYESLLKSRRQVLHGKIARVIEERFAATADAEPEVLAHHYTEAKQPEKAILFWHKAGQLALARAALIEAVAVLRKGLNMLAGVPDGRWRQQQELDLRIALRPALAGTEGFVAGDAIENIARARALAEHLDRPEHLVPLTISQWAVHLGRCEHKLALLVAEQLETIGETGNDIEAQLAGHYIHGISCIHLGEFVAARAVLERCLGLSAAGHRVRNAWFQYNDIAQIPGYLGVTLSHLGYADQARLRLDEALSEARRITQPYTLSNVLLLSSWIESIARSADLQRHAEELQALSIKHGFSLHLAWALAFRGWLLTVVGQVQEGLAVLRQGLVAIRATGSVTGTAALLVWLAEAYAMLKQPADGLDCLAEAAQIIETTEERCAEAELRRVRGDLLNASGDASSAERAYLQAVAVAERQSARLWQLRASVSLARFWRDRGKCAQAYGLLAPIYGWFTEGFDSKDLIDAKALLEELAVDPGSGLL